jgi:streptomycin 6-kinase
MEPRRSVEAVSPTAAECGKAFDRYVALGDRQIPEPLVSRAWKVYAELCASQGNTRLLHGDLQQSNVLFDRERGWVAVDPKGVVAETEYELGAALRNPREAPELVAQPATIERRLGQFCARLSLDPARVIGWTFSQAVLSAIWDVEDGFAVDATAHLSLRLAEATKPMVSG